MNEKKPASVLGALIGFALLFCILPGCDKAKEMADNAVNQVKEDFKSAKDKITEASKPDSGKANSGSSGTSSTRGDKGSATKSVPLSQKPSLTLEEFNRIPKHQVEDRNLTALLKHPGNERKITELDLRRSRISAKGLELLSRFPNLEILNLSRVGSTLGNMKYVGQLRKLRVINLSENPLTDSDFAQIASLSKLEEIDIRKSRITDNGFSCFGQMPNLSVLIIEGLPQLEGKGFRFVNKNSLKKLFANGTSIGLYGFQSLGGSESLEVLWANKAQVSDKSIAALARCTNLKELFLENNAITDKGVGALRRTTSLVKLDLAGNSKLSDNAVQALTGLKALRQVNFRNTRCTGIARETMAKAIPGVEFAY